MNEIDSSSPDEDNEVNNLILNLQEDLGLAKKFELFLLDAEPCVERSRKFKKESQNWQGNKARLSLKISAGEQNTSACSENEDDIIIQSKKTFPLLPFNWIKHRWWRKLIN